MEPRKEKLLLDEDTDETLSFTTTSGCLFVFDEECGELLVFGTRGSELTLTLADLRELAAELRRRPCFDKLRGLLLSASDPACEAQAETGKAGERVASVPGRSLGKHGA